MRISRTIRRSCRLFLLIGVVVLGTLHILLEQKQKANQEVKKSLFKMPVRGENNIFFLETKCAVRNSTETSPPQVRLTVQSSCAIESASRANPSASVYLYHSCPLDPGSLQRSPMFVQETLALHNVFIWNQDVGSMFEDTALEEWYLSGSLSESDYPTEHASDVLRVLALLKFGGVYLDLDFIITRNFGNLPASWAVKETVDWVANSALAMSVDGVGKRFAQMVVEELRTNFHGDAWSQNGGGAISRVLHKLCKYSDIDTMIANANDPSNCHGFVALQSHVFFPLMYTWRDLFNETHSDAVMKMIEHAHGVHLWNNIKSDVSYNPESRQPMALLRQQFCPVTHKMLLQDAFHLQP